MVIKNQPVVSADFIRSWEWKTLERMKKHHRKRPHFYALFLQRKLN